MYGKLFASMYDGTLATRGPWQALVTFQQMIILADREGYIDMTADAISRRTSIPVEIIEAGIKVLLEPDHSSRSPAENGRRIIPIDDTRDWGWQIVNYQKYRQMRSADERREYLRHAQASHRARLKELSTNVNTSTGGQQCQPIADADADADAKKKRLASSPNGLSAGDVILSLPCNTGDEVPIGKTFLEELAKAYPDVDPVGTLREIRAWCIANPQKRKTKSGMARFINSWFARVQNG